MKYQAILFDLDGTLVPMDAETFTKGYFEGLVKKLAKHGLSADEIIRYVWAGTKAMVMNDGTKTNEDAFWNEFYRLSGKSKEEINADCLDFYAREFDDAKRYTLKNELAKDAVALAREKAEYVILATNPLFPMVGQRTRMSWVGLTEADFDLVTAYETQRYCKPNPAYYVAICEKTGLDPKACLMIGNDENEDMYAAASVGMDTYLVTDCVIKSEKHPYEGKRGTFSDLVALLKSL
ncbi:MAG: HAD family hydrolase [Clostridia bacterium]|nr:HAD family hydrolase [Clostridia bacterium]